TTLGTSFSATAITRRVITARARGLTSRSFRRLSSSGTALWARSPNSGRAMTACVRTLASSLLSSLIHCSRVLPATFSGDRLPGESRLVAGVDCLRGGWADPPCASRTSPSNNAPPTTRMACLLPPLPRSRIPERLREGQRRIGPACPVCPLGTGRSGATRPEALEAGLVPGGPGPALQPQPRPARLVAVVPAVPAERAPPGVAAVAVEAHQRLVEGQPAVGGLQANGARQGPAGEDAA